MSPSELKKLRNKQKKAKRKAEAEKANAQQAQQRKEAHNKSQKKGPGGDEELDAPQKDELVPEKLERPDKPLEEALKFLTPLQNLAMQDLDTHFAAFEIYYRKGNLQIDYPISECMINNCRSYILQSLNQSDLIGLVLYFYLRKSFVL